jgi:predicted  nucleic acid-binding Zn-ribbon protein
MDASTTALAEAKTSCSNSATDASLRAAEAAEKKGAELQEAVDRQAEIAAQLFKINTANSALNEAKAAADKAAADKAAADKAAADNAAADNAAYEIRLMAAKSKYSALSLEIESLLKRYPSKKSEIELYKKKITLFERIDQVNISTVELNLAGIESKLDAMKSIYSKIARTITCTKGKKSLKVLDVNPKCPAGYKKK